MSGFRRIPVVPALAFELGKNDRESTLHVTGTEQITFVARRVAALTEQIALSQRLGHGPGAHDKPWTLASQHQAAVVYLMGENRGKRHHRRRRPLRQTQLALTQSGIGPHRGRSR